MATKSWSSDDYYSLWNLFDPIGSETKDRQPQRVLHSTAYYTLYRHGRMRHRRSTINTVTSTFPYSCGNTHTLSTWNGWEQRQLLSTLAMRESDCDLFGLYCTRHSWRLELRHYSLLHGVLTMSEETTATYWFAFLLHWSGEKKLLRPIGLHLCCSMTTSENFSSRILHERFATSTAMMNGLW